MEETPIIEEFYNQRMPNVLIDHEKPEHRLILWMKAHGHSNREIAAVTGYSEAWLSQVLRQPWAQERLASFINNVGRGELETILQSAAKDALYTLIELQENAQNESVRRAAADSILDRYLGKPKQSVQHELRNNLDNLSDAELAAIATGSTLTVTET